jgi:hypothetical protein
MESSGVLVHAAEGLGGRTAGKSRGERRVAVESRLGTENSIVELEQTVVGKKENFFFPMKF